MRVDVWNVGQRRLLAISYVHETTMYVGAAIQARVAVAVEDFATKTTRMYDALTSNVRGEK